MKTKCAILPALLLAFIAWQPRDTYSQEFNYQTLHGTITGSPIVGNLSFVQNGADFAASFTTPFGLQWLATANFTDNQQIIFEISSPSPGANIGSNPEIITWQFSGLGFEVQNFLPVALPPGEDYSVPSFDQNDVWMGWYILVPSTYVYQVVPIVPEPGTTSLVIGGLCVFASSQIRQGRGRIRNA